MTPSGEQWRPLGAADEDAASAWLAQRPARDVQLAAVLWRHGCVVPSSMGEVRGIGDPLAGVALVGPTTLLSCRPAAARLLGRRAGAMTQLMAPRPMFDSFFAEYVAADPTLVRPALHGMALDAVPPGLPAPIRRARRSELALLRPHCRAVTQEELGVDPEQWHKPAFLGGLQRRLEAGRELVWTEGEQLRFRAGIAAVGPGAVLVEGVWVPPELRRRGYARAGMIALALLLLPLHARVSLFVAADNRPARALYDSLGFAPTAVFSAAFWKPTPPKRRRFSLLR